MAAHDGKVYFKIRFRSITTRMSFADVKAGTTQSTFVLWFSVALNVRFSCVEVAGSCYVCCQGLPGDCRTALSGDVGSWHKPEQILCAAGSCRTNAGKVAGRGLLCAGRVVIYQLVLISFVIFV